MEVNYFYLGRLYRKTNRYNLAIKAFNTSLTMIDIKLAGRVSIKNEQTRQFWHNLKAKIYYKLSKCYRNNQDDDEERMRYERMALNEANKIGNLKL